MQAQKLRERLARLVERMRERAPQVHEALAAVISEAPQNDPEEIQALYLGEAKRKKLLNEFLIPARSEQDESPIARSRCWSCATCC